MGFLDETVESLSRNCEEAEHERDRALERVLLLESEAAALGDVIGDATRKLGLQGRDGDDLLDAIGQLERFLEGRELKITCNELGGIACELRRLIDLAHVGTRSLACLLYTANGASDIPLGLTPGLSSILHEPVTPELVFELTASQHGAHFVDVEGVMVAIADSLNGA